MRWGREGRAARRARRRALRRIVCADQQVDEPRGDGATDAGEEEEWARDMLFVD
jgi:hypothetical protein